METNDCLPTGYTYKIIPSDNENLFILRIKEVNSEETAEVWFGKYKNTSYWTWRVSETFPHSGRINIFKRKYRCEHKVSSYTRVQNPKRIRESKNTNCPAFFTMAVKRFKQNSKSKNPDYHINQEWPCIVEFCYQHNHEMKSTPTLNYPLSTEITEIFDVGSNKSEKVLFQVATDTEPLENWTENDYEKTVENIEENIFDSDVPELLPNALKILHTIIERIKNGVSDQPEGFVPALNKMVLNYEKFVRTDQQLITSMNKFGR